MNPSISTLRQITSFICKEGVARGYAVVPEFNYNFGEIKFDIAWCVPCTQGGDFTPVAIFEVEGANVPISDIRGSREQGLRRHYSNFDLFPNIPSNRKVVVLYTRSFDRKSWDNKKDYDRDVLARKKDAQNRQLTVVTGDELVALFEM